MNLTSSLWVFAKNEPRDLFPPVEALEDICLHAFAGIILKHQELRALKMRLNREGAEDHLAELDAVGREHIQAAAITMSR